MTQYWSILDICVMLSYEDTCESVRMKKREQDVFIVFHLKFLRQKLALLAGVASTQDLPVCPLNARVIHAHIAMLSFLSEL